MGENNVEEDAEVPEEAVSVKMKKWCVQKMTTRDLIEAHWTSSHQHPGNSMVLVIFHLYSSSQMLLLTETVLCYWDLFDASSSAKEGGAHYGRVRDWAQNNVKGSIGGAQTSTSHITSASNSQVSSFAHSKSLGVKGKGSTRLSHSNATQPLAMPTSAVIPASYLDEDNDITEFTNPAQECTAKEWGISCSMITDTGVSCMTWSNRYP